MKDISIHFPGLGTYTRNWLAQHPADAQELLADCKGRYPTCQCRQPGPRLYIAHQTKYYLARFPGSGPDHAPHCPSFEAESTECGRGIYTNTALSERRDGRISVKLGVPLIIRGGGRPPPPSSAGALTSGPKRETLKLRGLLHLLWETAGFNRWAPRMDGRRHYRQIFKYVSEAAERIIVRRQALHKTLFVPEPFVPSQKLEIDARRAQALRRLSRGRGGVPRRVLLIAQIKEIIGSNDGCELRVAHTPPQLVIRCARDMASRLQRCAAHAFVDPPAIHEEFRVLVLLTMLRDNRGAWIVDDLATLVCNKHYIPVHSVAEAILAKHLIAQGRYFYKPMNYDAEPSHYPNFLLTDQSTVSVPIEVCISDHAGAARQNDRIARYLEDDREYVLWNPRTDEAPPDLRVKASA